MQAGRLCLTLIALAFCAPWAHADQDWYKARSTLMTPGSYFIAFYQTKGALSYQPMDGKDLPANIIDAGTFQDKSCQFGISVPISPLAVNSAKISAHFGDGTYFKTLRKIRKKHPELAGLFDIKADLQTVSVLGIFAKECVIVAARGFMIGANRPPGVYYTRSAGASP
jgi:hypothetical protein